MNTDDLIAVTGAAGFIGSCFVSYLNNKGFDNLVLVDDFSVVEKLHNLKDARFTYKVHREQLRDWLEQHPGTIQYFFHLGARTDTTETDKHLLKKWNLEYSKMVWEFCTEQRIPLVYASSAATYGDGEHGYIDSHELPQRLTPLNPYGKTKNDFDIWALEQKKYPPFWAGTKFFNVYGPNEYHKGRMASVVFHAYRQIKKDGKIKLFKSHNPKYPDGGQLRDFIYVKDVLSILDWLMETRPANGLYNVGTGKAATFLQLAKAIFKALDMPESIAYIDTPEDIRDKYQYFTEANMSKLKNVGYDHPFYPVEEGVKDYINNYLSESGYF